ncbi:MAG TPA: pyrroline-5-carboxylate reductase [Nitrospirota bacterium]|jgi:pyrroline-5-carboxylate reductase
MNKKIAFLGSGNMAEAMVRGLITSGLVTKEDITVSDVSAERLLYMKKTYEVSAVHENTKAAEGKDVIVVAVKPSNVRQVLGDIAAVQKSEQLIVSIAAGLTVDTIEGWMDHRAKVVRAMPNTPALIQEGAAAIFGGRNCDVSDIEVARKLLSAVCKVVVAVNDEKMMDAVTGLSGSGPAYVFLILEALSDAGVRMGLSRDDSFQLAAQTLIGSAAMALQTRDPLSKLKDMVTSPGGTTIAGLQKLEESAVRAAMYSAVEAATMRSRELGNK